MSDDLVKIARDCNENGPPKPPFYATGLLISAMADRIEELEAKLAKAVEDCANVAKRMADEALTPAAREHAEQIAEAIIAELNPDAR